MSGKNMAQISKRLTHLEQLAKMLLTEIYGTKANLADVYPSDPKGAKNGRLTGKQVLKLKQTFRKNF